MECNGAQYIQTTSVISSTRFNKVEDNYNLKAILKQSSECPLYNMTTMLFHRVILVKFSLQASANFLNLPYEHKILVLVGLWITQQIEEAVNCLLRIEVLTIPKGMLKKLEEVYISWKNAWVIRAKGWWKQAQLKTKVMPLVVQKPTVSGIALTKMVQAESMASKTIQTKVNSIMFHDLLVSLNPTTKNSNPLQLKALRKVVTAITAKCSSLAWNQ